MTERITVLGAGLVGILTALSLTERGEQVLLIDRGAPGQETSAGNAGIISPWSIVPQAMPGLWKSIPSLMMGQYRPLSVRVSAWPGLLPWGLRFLRNGHMDRVRATSQEMQRLCAPSIDLYRHHLKGTGAEHLLRDSFYVHAFRQETAANPNALEYEMRREAGAKVRKIDAADLRALEPDLGRVFKAAILIEDQARAVSPGEIGTVLARKFTALGGRLLRAEARGIQPDEGHWIIDCGTRIVRTERLVLALGAWSARLLAPLGINLPLIAERGYHVEYPRPGLHLNHSVMDVASKVVASSMESGLRVAGQAEFADVETPLDPRRKARFDRIAREILPGLEPALGKVWMGRRPSFPDSLPAIGALPAYPGLFCNFGHSHYGLMMAPKSGEIIADLMTGRISNVDMTALSPMRFATG